MTHAPHDGPTGPLILGAGGRIGQAFRALHAAGRWPSGAAPIWHARQPLAVDDYSWDMLAGPAPHDPRLPDAAGMIVLAGGRGRGDIAPDEAGALTRAALSLAARHDIGPVILCSSQAVYGPVQGPHDEGAPLRPHTDYGRAKHAMEIAAGDAACALRIGNVAGCDMLLRNAARGPVTLDRFADGRGPRRCYVGPRTLARIMLALIAQGRDLPRAVNVAAAPGTVAMETLLTEAGLAFDWRPAPATALPDLQLDLTRLTGLVPLDPASATPARLICEARDAGWRPAA